MIEVFRKSIEGWFQPKNNLGVYGLNSKKIDEIEKNYGKSGKKIPLRLQRRIDFYNASDNKNNP